MSLIQSTYDTPTSPGSFETVLLQGSNLVHYWRDNKDTSGTKWVRTEVITNKASAPGAIFQSKQGTPLDGASASSVTAPGGPGNFEVVVLEGRDLVHYTRDDSAAGGKQWKQGATITSNASGPGSIIQGNFATPNQPGNLEVIVPEGDQWVHYWRDDSQGASGSWKKSTNIASTSS